MFSMPVERRQAVYLAGGVLPHRQLLHPSGACLLSLPRRLGYPINQRLEPAKPSHAISKVSGQRRRKGGLERQRLGCATFIEPTRKLWLAALADSFFLPEFVW